MNIEQELRMIVDAIGIDFIEIPENTQYWLVRTYSGKYYETFHSHNFIGVGWYWEKDLCESARIKPSDNEYLIAMRQYKKSNYYSRIISSFITNLKIGDIVICPAYHSTNVLLGKIISDVTFADNDFPYARKRTVEWITEIHWTEIPQKMFRFLSTQHGMCSAQNISADINRIMYPFYLAGNKAHLTLRVLTQEAISLKDINELLSFMTDILSQDNSISVKIELSSPGFLQFIGSPKGMLLLAIFLHFIVGGKIEVNPKTLTISNETKGLIGVFMEHKNKQRFSQKLEELEVDLDHFNTNSQDITSPDTATKPGKNTQAKQTQ